MDHIMSASSPNPNIIKFGKCNSCSSVRTEADPQPLNEFVPRKISEELKKRLIHLITVQNYNMKEAAKIIQISYSTAKKIFTKFKRALRAKTQKKQVEEEGKIRCAFTEIACQLPLEARRVGVISTVAGNLQGRSQDVILIVRSDC